MKLDTYGILLKKIHILNEIVRLQDEYIQYLCFVSTIGTIIIIMLVFFLMGIVFYEELARFFKWLKKIINDKN